MTALSWIQCNESGPKLAYHAGALVGDSLIIHGGVQVCTSEDIHVQPQSQTYAFDLARSEWRTLPSGPALSHHTCITTNDNRLIFIGGWDGHERTSDVHVFDVAAQTWSHPRTSGFPNGAGLSSHSASLLKNGDILVVGREGSLRFQRRAGNAFRLTYASAKREFQYVKELTSVQSRSGHTAAICGRTLFLVGGRGDLLETHDGYQSGSRVSSLVTRLCQTSQEDSAQRKAPYSRKNHVLVAGSGGFLVHGGYVFDGKVKQVPTGETLLCKDGDPIRIFRLPVSGVSCERAAHVAGYDDNRVFVHGGLTASNTVCGDVFCLKTS